MGGKHDDGCVGKFFADDAGRFDAVDAGQLQIHEDDVRTMFWNVDGQEAVRPIPFNLHPVDID